MVVEMKNHNFEINDLVVVKHSYSGFNTAGGREYVVLDVGFMNVKLLNDDNKEVWINAWSLNHVPRVTIVKKHLRRIVLGR